MRMNSLRGQGWDQLYMYATCFWICSFSRWLPFTDFSMEMCLMVIDHGHIFSFSKLFPYSSRCSQFWAGLGRPHAITKPQHMYTYTPLHECPGTNSHRGQPTIQNTNWSWDSSPTTAGATTLVTNAPCSKSITMSWTTLRSEVQGIRFRRHYNLKIHGPEFELIKDNNPVICIFWCPRISNISIREYITCKPFKVEGFWDYVLAKFPTLQH